MGTMDQARSTAGLQTTPARAQTGGHALHASLQQAAMWREQAGSLPPSPPKAAKLHPPVEHAPKSDTTIFAQPAIEVHALCNGTPAPRVGPYSPKIQRMLDSRRERHTLAWQQYTASRNAAERELQASVGSLVAGLRERLASSDARLEANMAQLADETVMQLEEAGVNEIWDIVDRAIPERRSWIDELGTALNTAEDGRRQAVEKGLRVMTQQMHDIAHLSPGDIERLGEEEAIKTNLDMLDNKKAYIDLQKRLQLAENEAAISRRQRWDAGLLAWRTLRTQHAITVFNRRIESPEFSEPAARLELFAELRTAQSAAYDRLNAHLQAVTGLLPPATSAEHAAAWAEHAQQLLSAWATQKVELLGSLRCQEDETDALAAAAFQTLQREALGYGGYPEAELQALLDSTCGPALACRRTDAVGLLDAAKAFLDDQAGQWHSMLESMGKLMAELSEMHDRHKASTRNINDAVRRALQTTGQEFDNHNEMREADFARAVLEVSQGSSEKVLDEKVAAALRCLDGIEDGYRSFHATMTSILRQHPTNISNASDAYEASLSTTLCVKAVEDPTNPITTAQTPGAVAPTPPAAASEASPAEAKSAGAMPNAAKPATAANTASRPAPSNKPAQQRTSQTGATEKRTSQSGAAQKEAGTASRQSSTGQPTAVQPPPADAAPETAPPHHQVTVELPCLTLANGVSFVQTDDMFNRHFMPPAMPSTAADATDAAIAKFDQINPQETPAATAAPTGKLTTAKSASLAKPAEPARSKASEGNRPKSPDAKGPPPSSTGTADAAADADAGTPPAEAPAIEIPGQRIPASQAGEPLCSELPTQADGIRQLLSAIRLAFLEEMDAFAEATCQDAASWANDQEVAETEALDARLRSHRPRAGRVEEETRQARAVELIAQRRKVDIHMRSQAKAIAAQEAAVKAAAEAAAEAAQKGIERLRAMEKLLFSCQSVKFLEIRKREAEAYKVKLDKELQAGCDQVTELSAASAQKLLDGNAKFGADTLKTFAEGGRFAPENVAEYQQKLASVTLAVEYNRASQAAAAEAARVAAVASANAALEAVISSLPPHRADLALIETLDRALEAARRNARHEFEASNAAAAAIEADAVLLQSLVDNKATAERECLQGLPCCQAILDTTERLRQALVLRAKSLQHLKSTAMTATPLDVQLTPAGAAGSGVTTSGGPATAAPTPRVPNPSVSNTPCVLATPRKDGKKAEPPADVVTTIAERIEGVISQSEAETAKVSQEYYAAAAAAVPKPKITRPERIPEDLAQMQELNRKILQELREQLAAHLAAAVDQLHNQVIRLSRILEKLPAAASDALTQHELALASAARQALSSGFEAQHATLAAQHRANKLALHPNLGHPTRQQELQDLSNQEAQRNASSVTLTKKHAAGAMELVGSQGPAVYMRQLRLTRLLLQLLDGFMMPDDLPGTESPAESAPDAPAVKEVPRKNLKQLKQMALARDQAAGEPAGAPAAAATAAKPAAAPSKLSKVPSSKGGKGAAALAAAVERPMAGMQWKLVAPAVSLVALGWTPEDAAKYKLEEPPAPISEEPRKTSLGAGKPGGAAAAKLKPPPAKAAATAAAQTPPSPATGALPAEEAVSGLNTPCHCACVLAHKSAAQRLEMHLREAVAAYKSQLQEWLEGESAAAVRWQEWVKQMGDLPPV